jgi:hypothetical protein
MNDFKSGLIFDKKWIHTKKHYIDFKNDFNNHLIEFDKKQTIELKLDNFSKVFNQMEESKKNIFIRQINTLVYRSQESFKFS